MKNLWNFLGLQSSSSKTKEYIEHLRSLREIDQSTNSLAEEFNLQKSQLNELNKQSDEDLKKKGNDSYNDFLKNQSKEISDLYRRKTKIEKSMQLLEKDKEMGNVALELKECFRMKKMKENKTISKAIYSDFMKAKQGVVKYADVLVFRGEKLLILQRAGENGSFSDEWCVPGGHVDMGEEFKEAAKRELYEETGIDHPEDKFQEVAVYKDDHCEIHYYVIHIDAQSPTTILIDSQEEIGSMWIDPTTEMEGYKFIFDMEDNIKRILGIENKDCCDLILKAFIGGLISKKIFNDFCLEHKEDIRKSQNRDYFSHKDREDLAKKGEAMPNGKFPIRNAQDLHDAIKLAGSSSMPKNEVKAWIKKRAKELGLEEELPENWRPSSKGDDIEKTMDTVDAQILSKESLDPEIKSPQGSGVGDNDIKKSREYKTMTIRYTDDGSLEKIVEHLRKTGNQGHSFSIVIDPDLSEKDGGSVRFGWDGDGCCQIESFKVEEEEQIEKSQETEEGFGLKIKFEDPEEAFLFKSLAEDWNNQGRINLSSIEEIGTIEEWDKQKSIEKSKDPMCEVFKNYMNFLEGVKIRSKNVHWSEEDNSKHVYLDELLEELNEYEDKIAEAGQSGFGRFADGEINGEEIKINDPVELVEKILERTKEFYEHLENNVDYAGEKSWVEDFIATLKQTKYRLQMH